LPAPVISATLSVKSRSIGSSQSAYVRVIARRKAMKQSPGAA
jgi:hypothetical protein